MTDGRHFVKQGFIINISREMALDHGLVEPTHDEDAERVRRRAEYQAKREAAQPRLRESIAALDALEGVERAVLDLHRVGSSSFGVGPCEGCDFSGYEAEPPEWPCRTVDLIAARHDIDVSDFHLFDPAWKP